MAFLEGKTPKERRNTILAIVLGSVAAPGIVYNFFLSNSKPKRTTSATATARATPTPAPQADIEDIRRDQPPTPVIYTPASTGAFAPGRNIFAYYSAPIGRPGGAGATSNQPIAAMTPVDIPTPEPPPIILAGVSPASLYARTGDFTLEVAGDKFTPATRVYFNGSEVPTTFESAQRLRAQVPAALIGGEGGRTVIIRTPDNSLYSNPVNFTVLPPPTPPFTYVGLIGRGARDTAVLKNRGNELLSVQRNDVVGGRFRLTNISEQSLELTDTELRIKHTLPFVEARNTTGAFGGRPQPGQRISPAPVDDDDINNEGPGN